MLKIYRNAIVVLCLVSFVGMLVGTAAAESISYDFDQNVGDYPLDTGVSLNDQDNWGEDHPSSVDKIFVASGEAGWTGNYIQNTMDGTSTTYLYRMNDANWAFSLQDGCDFNISAKFSSESGRTTTVGLDYSNSRGHDNWIVFGVYDTNFGWWVRENHPDDNFTSFVNYTESMPTIEANIYEVGFEVTAIGGNVYDFLPYYQDLSTPSSRVYANGGTPFTANFSYALSGMFDTVYLRMGGTTGGILDDFEISQVPEPSTLALLASGLIGLLAYAWRKRK